MGEVFLSNGWFALLQEHLGSGVQRLGLSCRVEFLADASDRQILWSVVVVDGVLLDASLGPCVQPDIRVCFSLEQAWRTWTGAIGSNEALARISIEEERADGIWHGPPSPMDLGHQPELELLPTYPGASLDVQYRYWKGPFGPVDFGLSIVDGRIRDLRLGRILEPDVSVSCTFVQMALVRNGQMSILDVLASGAKIEGTEGALALLAGISESDEFHAAELACGRSGFALGVLGEVFADAPGLEQTRSLTGAPDAL